MILFFIRCQNQTNLNSQVSVIVPPTPPTSITPPPSSSSPSRPSSSNDAKIPYSSANSPSSKKPVSNRFSNNNNPPILPSYPPLPPSNNRPSNHITSSSSGSSSSADASRSLPSVEVNQSSVARARRRIRVRQNNPLPINDQQMDINFLSKLRENDTLQRRNREKKINNHLKQYQQLSSDDEHELISQANPSQPVVVYIDLCSLYFRFQFDFQVVVPPKKPIRPNSAASSVESNHSKFSFDDDSCGFFNERESPRQPSQSKTTNSYDSNNLPNANARQRRRDSRIQSSIEASSPTTTTNSTNYESSQEPNSAEIEKKKEG